MSIGVLTSAPPVRVDIINGTSWLDYLTALAPLIALGLGGYSIYAERRRAKEERLRIATEKSESERNEAQRVIVTFDLVEKSQISAETGKSEVIPWAHAAWTARLMITNATSGPILAVQLLEAWIPRGHYRLQWSKDENTPSLTVRLIQAGKTERLTGRWVTDPINQYPARPEGLINPSNAELASEARASLQWSDASGKIWRRDGFDPPRAPLAEHGGRGPYGDNPRFSWARLKWELSKDGRRIKRQDRQLPAR